jgi:hypothetical protein
LLLVTNLVPLPKPPILLVDRGKSGVEMEAVDSAHEFVPANFLGYLGQHPELITPERLRSGEPATLHFWYRGSPVVMVPTGDQARVSQTDPPMTVARMTMVQVDPEGRLVSMAVVPPQVDPVPAQQTPPIDWRPFGPRDSTAAFARSPPSTPRIMPTAVGLDRPAAGFPD